MHSSVLVVGIQLKESRTVMVTVNHTWVPWGHARCWHLSECGESKLDPAASSFALWKDTQEKPNVRHDKAFTLFKVIYIPRSGRRSPIRLRWRAIWQMEMKVSGGPRRQPGRASRERRWETVRRRIETRRGEGWTPECSDGELIHHSHWASCQKAVLCRSEP